MKRFVRKALDGELGRGPMMLKQQVFVEGDDRIPLPPADLAGRVGSQLGNEFLQLGKSAKRCIERALGDDFSCKGKRILDFGCGAGRLMRHYFEEAQECEFWGCDIHRPSIEWLERHLIPPFRVFLNREDPPLPFIQDYFDLVIVLSVFTHLTDSWEAWLAEIRRILKPGALALLTFHHKLAYEHLYSRPFDEGQMGMQVFHEDQVWEKGGPFVFHSNWWVRENWGRIMPVERIVPGGLDNWQSIAILRKQVGA